MGKPIFPVSIATVDGKTGSVRTVFDTGSHRSLIRENCLPAGAQVLKTVPQRVLKTAAAGGTLTVVGVVVLTMTIGDRMIEDEVLVSRDLSQEMLIGAGTMQQWDITIRNQNGNTEVVVGHDLRDPDIQEVD